MTKLEETKEYITEQIEIRKRYIAEDMKHIPQAIRILEIEVQIFENVLEFMGRPVWVEEVKGEPDFSL